MLSLNWLKLLEVSEMVRIFVRKIQAGELTIDDVPVRWREKVREALGD